MKISLLCENAASDVGCLAEWGFSSFIQNNKINVLFDTGYSEVYKHNAARLGINLDDADFVVISHFHSDHTGGLRFHNFSTRKKLILHPHVLEKLPKEEAKKIHSDFEIVTTVQPLEFSKDFFFLGEIPRKNDFEKGRLDNDPLLDDSAIAIKTEKGAVIITGCSHAGICNICEYAKEVTGLDLFAVIGGFHLFEHNKETIQSTLDYFQKEKPAHLLPMHCVDYPTLAKFHTILGSKKYSAGDVIDLYCS